MSELSEYMQGVFMGALLGMVGTVVGVLIIEYALTF